MRPEQFLEVAVVQASAPLFDAVSGMEKACRLIVEAGASGARLVVLPEAFVGGYPRGLSFGAVVGSRTREGRNLFARYHEGALEVPGPGIERLGAAARRAKAFVAVGVVEREAGHPGTLYCALLYFGPDGTLLGRHRKLKPTASERLVWGEGDASGLTVLDTPFGRVGGLICWENYMPLARAALQRMGVTVHLAPTADARPAWQATMVHVAVEGRAFVLGCNQVTTKGDYPADLLAHPEIQALPDVLCRGGSVIVSPLGDVVAGPVWDEERILRARLDLREVVRARLDFDAAGHYARPDVFRFEVPGLPEPISCRPASEEGAPAGGTDPRTRSRSTPASAASSPAAAPPRRRRTPGRGSRRRPPASRRPGSP
ncbi:MAG TPA: carbon-nitrogen hydrolase family protein [Myxococcaceae bacterium]|nr:carbon-nitrogen hydrolase family protein [Myxococcaceae bacterium]